MTMKTSLSILLMSITSVAFGQGAPDNGVELRNEGKYADAINHYRKLQRNGYWDWGHKYNYSKVLALAGELDSCFYYLYDNINENISKQSLRDIEFIEIKDDIRWDNYEEIVIMEHLPCKNVPLSAQIFRLIALSEKDDNNINLLFDFVKIHGWPKKSEVGEATNYLFGILGSKDLFIEKSSRHLDTLEKLCLDGEISGEYFANLYDAIQRKANKPQKYGTIFDIDFKNNQQKIYYKLISKKSINKWRVEIGLKQLEEFIPDNK